MTTEGGTHTTLQLPLDVPATPKLTDRQTLALAFLRGAGTNGLKASSLGFLMHVRQGAHTDARGCDYCSSAGNELLRALRRKGVARQRRVDGRTFWQATGLPVERARGMSEDIPF